MRAIALVLAAALAAPALAAAPKTEEEKTLYALGLWLGQKVSMFNLSAAELAFVNAGLKDSATGAKERVKLEDYANRLNDLAQSRVKAAAEKRKAADKAFADKAAKEKGAQSFPSGLVYQELKPGKGASPKATDKVKVHYHGTFPAGGVFDSSVERKQPIDFPLNGVIPCWTEGVQKMKVGGKSRLICPSSIAYGDGGSPPKIPGGATLVFEVELLDIVKN